MKNKSGKKRCGSPRLRQRNGEEAAPVPGQGESAALPQSNGEEAAPVRGQGEVAAPARRDRFAAVIEMLRRFWARLLGIGQMPGSFIRRRSVSGEAAELPPAVEVADLPLEVAGVPRGRRRRRYRRPRRRPNQAEELSQEPEKKQSPPLLMVNDLPVPEEQKLQYKEYCKARAGYPENVTFYHMCFFHNVKYDGGKFPDSKMFLHYARHEVEGSMRLCPFAECRIKVGSIREEELHIHFCHTEPAGWWDK